MWHFEKLQRLKEFLFVVGVLILLSCLVGCGKNASETSQTTEKDAKIVITPENYEEYFVIKFTDDFKMHESPLSGTWFSHIVTATCRSTVTASFSHVELTGKVQVSVDQKSHLLYTENKLPLEVTIIIDGTGFGEGQVRFEHGRGSYGGFMPEDFYFECTSASGYIELR